MPRSCSLPLLQYLGDLGCDYVVFPNDAKSVEEIRQMNPRGILVSPGPGGRPLGVRARRRESIWEQQMEDSDPLRSWRCCNLL